MFQELGKTGDRSRRGRKSTINTTRDPQLIGKRVQQNITSNNKRVRQNFTSDNKRVRLERYRRLIRRFTPLNREKILFTDEELFTIELPHNHHNDRRWCAEAPGTSAIIEHCQNPKPVMVWAEICIRHLWFSSMRW